MRFNDSLQTVLTADIDSPVGAQLAWRQLVDLIARQRAPASAASMAMLTSIRARVPLAVRAASARAAAAGSPPLALIELLARDGGEMIAPILRHVDLPVDDWVTLLPAIGPTGRAVLRHRRDLAPEVVRALAGFSGDFLLGDGRPATEAPAIPLPPDPAPLALEDMGDAGAGDDFQPIGRLARGVPAVVEAMRQRGAARSAAPAPSAGAFEIPDIVARIDAYRRQREQAGPPAPATEAASAPVTLFSFETDARGVIHWVSGVDRAPVIGISLEYGAGGAAEVDGIARGAFRRRAPIDTARLVIGGASPAAGEWRIVAIPVFDRASGRFTGYRGTARRPRPDESLTPPPLSVDSLRQLVHELRTPASAIVGFADMIDGEVLGPVAPPYRDYAGRIADQARGLLGAIEDLDMIARIEARALDLRTASVALAPLLGRIAGDLAPLATLRGVTVTLEIDRAMVARGDERAIERLVARLMSVLVAAAARDEQVSATAAIEGDDVLLRFSRPAALPAIEPDGGATGDIEPGGAALPLGAPFALRLVRNLARELGGGLMIGDAALTLRLPAAFADAMGHASNR